MRYLFTDGWNSFWHFVFGIIGFYFGWVVVLFFMYQLKTPQDTNITIDITEFAIGYFLIRNFYMYILSKKQLGRSP